MKNFRDSLAQLYREDRGAFALIVLNLLLSAGLFTYAMVSLNPNSAVVKIGYGDIGGYRDGTWVNILMYPVLAILFGVLHNLLALKVFRKRGGAMAKFFLLTTTMLILGTFVVLVRILKEG